MTHAVWGVLRFNHSRTVRQVMPISSASLELIGLMDGHVIQPTPLPVDDDSKTVIWLAADVDVAQQGHRRKHFSLLKFAFL